MQKEIWVVEQREKTKSGMVSHVAFIASSVLLAKEWIMENDDYHNGDFWWAVYYAEIDKDITEQKNPKKDLYLFNKLGEEIYWQPYFNQSVIYYKDKVNFGLHYNFLVNYNDCTFEAVLECIKDEVVMFKDVFVTSKKGAKINEPFNDTFLVKVEEIDFIENIKDAN